MVRLPFDPSLLDRKLQFKFDSESCRNLGIFVDGNIVSQMSVEARNKSGMILYDVCWRIYSRQDVDNNVIVSQYQNSQFIDDPMLARIIAMMIINEKSKGDEIELALRALGYGFSGYKLIRNHLTGGYVVQRKAQDMSELASFEDLIKSMKS